MLRTERNGVIGANEIFGVQPVDPAVIGLAVMLLGTISLIARILPVRRAPGIDPAFVVTK